MASKERRAGIMQATNTMAQQKKRPSKKTRPNRNALCPCGSGRAFKNCCAGKQIAAATDKPESLPNQFKRLAVGLGVIAVVAVGVGLAVLRPWEEDAAGAGGPSGTTERYWHAGHGHWHDGPRPDVAQELPFQAPTSPGAPGSPQPWEYNAVTDQHWHPTHGHWHDGQPPLPGQR